MAFTEKLKRVIFPALLVIGIGVLEIKFPSAMDGFNDGYTGRGVAGLILLIFELLVCSTWGKTGGAIAILLGTMAIVPCVLRLPKTKKVEETPAESFVTDDDDGKNLNANALGSFALRVGKRHVQQKLQSGR